MDSVLIDIEIVLIIVVPYIESLLLFIIIIFQNILVNDIQLHDICWCYLRDFEKSDKK